MYNSHNQRWWPWSTERWLGWNQDFSEIPLHTMPLNTKSLKVHRMCLLLLRLLYNRRMWSPCLALSLRVDCGNVEVRYICIYTHARMMFYFSFSAVFFVSLAWELLSAQSRRTLYWCRTQWRLLKERAETGDRCESRRRVTAVGALGRHRRRRSAGCRRQSTSQDRR